MNSGGTFDENFIRLYWQQMLQVRGTARCLICPFTPPPAHASYLSSLPYRIVTPSVRQAVATVHELRIVHSDLKVGGGGWLG